MIQRSRKVGAVTPSSAPCPPTAPIGSAAHAAVRSPFRATAAAVLTGAALVLSGCTVRVPPGPDAANPECAPIIVSLPDELIGLERRETTSQSTAAWGEGEKTVVLRCGVEPPPPTTDLCTTMKSASGTVDWIVREDDETGIVTFTTYGRSPAVDITVPRAAAPDQPSSAPLGVAGLVAPIEQTKFCVGPGEA